MPPSKELKRAPTSSTSISLNATVGLALFLLVALFPSAFHVLWSVPLHLLSPSTWLPHPHSNSEIDPHNSNQYQGTMSWTQKTFTLPSKSRGSYLITDTVIKELTEIKSYKVGLLHLFIQHTSCALSLNENYDSDVREDMSDALDRIAPEDREGELYRHSAEGLDDMPVSFT
jgi:hypothetical protein